jgi:hypothetical protein
VGRAIGFMPKQDHGRDAEEHELNR